MTRTTDPSCEQAFADWMHAIQRRTETALDHALPAVGIAPARLHEAMRYATLGAGKRVRALLAHAAGELVGAQPEALDLIACALECIHAYSLVHDDMPCMDNDTLRRGKPTVHIQYDEATALLVGDALQTQAFELLARPGLGVPDARRLAMVTLLAQASGSRGMAGGQAMDLANVGRRISRAELEVMHLHKTGALIRAAVLLGADAGAQPLPAAQREQLDVFSKRAGLLFQVVDDILDDTASTATLGKTAGKDAMNDKPTYVSLLGLTDARRLADELLLDARTALAALGEAAHRLGQVLDFIACRSH
ncbi:MAG: polyprenyl synthetase family protein [Ottowia sp.]|nr:polyprenyl synthetase family protein [Ottowia sp.]